MTMIIQNNYRYHSMHKLKTEVSTHFHYYCSQSRLHQNSSKKCQHNGAKPHDKESITMFDCAGWLHITVNEKDSTALIKLKHEDDHIPYWCIDVP